METVAEELRERGVDEGRIVYLDLERRGLRSVRTPDQLEAAIESRLPEDSGGITYLFVDEAHMLVGAGGAAGEMYLGRLEKKLLGAGNSIGSYSPVEELVPAQTEVMACEA